MSYQVDNYLLTFLLNFLLSFEQEKGALILILEARVDQYFTLWSRFLFF